MRAWWPGLCGASGGRRRRTRRSAPRRESQDLATGLGSNLVCVQCPACGRSRVPGVMTTTLRANAQELQVSATVEENAGDASARGSGAASSPQPIATALEKLQSAL
eukprot:scaffold6317_cov98-Phaeocystis_antarctica.AAC.5